MAYVNKLDFSNNRLTELSPFITNLPALEMLDLSNNNLLGLPNEVGLLSNLKVLRVVGNGIKLLPRTLGLLSGKMQEITFDKEHISWPSGQEVLSMDTGKLLKFLAAFYQAEQDRVLELMGWNFETVPDDVFGEPDLVTLKLSHNKIREIPDK